jgi:hypothetical protein
MLITTTLDDRIFRNWECEYGGEDITAFEWEAWNLEQSMLDLSI